MHTRSSLLSFAKHIHSSSQPDACSTPQGTINMIDITDRYYRHQVLTSRLYTSLNVFFVAYLKEIKIFVWIWIGESKRFCRQPTWYLPSCWILHCSIQKKKCSYLPCCLDYLPWRSHVSVYIIVTICYWRPLANICEEKNVYTWMCFTPKIAPLRRVDLLNEDNCDKKMLQKEWFAWWAILQFTCCRHFQLSNYFPILESELVAFLCCTFMICNNWTKNYL